MSVQKGLFFEQVLNYNTQDNSASTYVLNKHIIGEYLMK